MEGIPAVPEFHDQPDISSIFIHQFMYCFYIEKHLSGLGQAASADIGLIQICNIGD